MALFSDIWEKIRMITSDVWDFLHPFIEVFLTEAGQALAKAALSAVSTIATTMNDADGDTKRKAAFELILKDLEAQGIQMGTSMINAALEAAVQKISK